MHSNVPQNVRTQGHRFRPIHQPRGCAENAPTRVEKGFEWFGCAFFMGRFEGTFHTVHLTLKIVLEVRPRYSGEMFAPEKCSNPSQSGPHVLCGQEAVVEMKKACCETVGMVFAPILPEMLIYRWSRWIEHVKMYGT